jgi:outer membrane receptor protein involved in Fe transport
MRGELRCIALAVASALGTASAQQAGVERMERVEITGSRILSSDVESPSPIAIITAKDVKVEGYQDLELILNNFPQFVPDQGNRLSNGATGTATANLRGLGAARTLVLVNGKRMPAGSPFVLSPDLNQIPPQLIQRVEVLTGGASAVYGSDAIAGVVNFILNDRFEGVQGDVAYDAYAHEQKNGVAQNMLRDRGIAIPADKWMDGESESATLTLGRNFAHDKGNAVVSVRYFKSAALPQSERDYSACPIGFPADSAIPVCVGSSANGTGRFQDLRFWSADPTIQPLGAVGPLLTLDPLTGQVRRFTPADFYNFAPTNYYQRPQERYGFNALAGYELSAKAKIYTELGYHEDQTVAQIAPTAIFFYPAPVRYENPLLTDDWRSRLVFRNPDGTIGTGPGTVANVRISRRNVDGGPRQDDLNLSSLREVLGLKGEVAGWDYDVFFQSARVKYREQYLHDFSNTRIGRSLDVVPDPVTGVPVCASFLTGVDRSCVPWNVWSLNGVTSAALAYVEVAPRQRASLAQHAFGGTATANLGDYGIRLPHTRGAIEVAFGFEQRTEKLDFQPDAGFLDLAGAGDPVYPSKGQFTVKELFTELRLPLFDAVNLTGSFRHSDYDTGFRTNTFGVGFSTVPMKFVRLRGSYQRAVRAPGLNELFQPQLPSDYGLADGLDPCAGETPSRSLADCQRTGVTASQYGHIVQAPEDGFPATSGGNPRLKAETAKTYTAGIVLTPFRDFSATLDYYDIRVEDTISGIDGAVIFNQCIDTGDPFFCSLVRRDPTGGLWYGSANVSAINENIGKMRVAGIDAAVNYRIRLPNGHDVLVDGLGSYLARSSIEVFHGAPTVDCAGQFASLCSGMPLPRWRHRLRGTWRSPWDFEFSATWRYIGSTTLAPTLLDLPVTIKIPPTNYLDIAGSWNITKQVTVRGGVANVTDRDPPLVIGPPPGVNGNTYAQLYDALGRHFFVALTVKF